MKIPTLISSDIQYQQPSQESADYRNATLICAISPFDSTGPRQDQRLQRSHHQVASNSVTSEISGPLLRAQCAEWMVPPPGLEPGWAAYLALRDINPLLYR